MIAGPAGKYYVLGSVSTEGVAVFSREPFQACRSQNDSLQVGVPVAFAITGDARRLVVIGSGVQVIDTATDALLRTRRD